MNTAIKTLRTSGLICLGVLTLSYTSYAQEPATPAASAQTTEPAVEQQASSATENRIELSGQVAATQEEIATIQVLSEICPQIIGKNKNFDAGYERLLADFLPFPDPKLALRALNEETNYTAILAQTRLDTAKNSQADNRQVCLDVIDWRSK